MPPAWRISVSRIDLADADCSIEYRAKLSSAALAIAGQWLQNLESLQLEWDQFNRPPAGAADPWGGGPGSPGEPWGGPGELQGGLGELGETWGSLGKLLAVVNSC